MVQAARVPISKIKIRIVKNHRIIIRNRIVIKMIIRNRIAIKMIIKTKNIINIINIMDDHFQN